MNSHTGETPYKCQDCGKEFRERVHLRQHRWTHSSDKFVCEICGTPFSRKGNMKEHIKKHHNYNKEGDKDGGFKYKKQGKEKLEEYQYQCGICSKIYSNETYLKIHLKSHSSQQAYYCSVCGKKFRHSGSLVSHNLLIFKISIKVNYIFLYFEDISPENSSYRRKAISM